MLFSILGPNSLPVVVFQSDKRHANRTAFVLEWYDRHRACNIWYKRRRICTSGLRNIWLERICTLVR